MRIKGDFTQPSVENTVSGVRAQLTGKESSEMIGGLNHGTVSGDIAHGREGVENLGAGNTRHAVHSKGRQISLAQGFDELLVLLGVEERVEDPAVITEQFRLGQTGLPQLQHNICPGQGNNQLGVDTF